MGGPTGVPQKSTTTTKDILIDFLAGGTGLFFSSHLNKRFSYFAFYFSCMYIVIMISYYLNINSCRELFQKQPLHHLNV
jgi:hypothetical protein